MLSIVSCMQQLHKRLVVLEDRVNISIMDTNGIQKDAYHHELNGFFSKFQRGRKAPKFTDGEVSIHFFKLNPLNKKIVTDVHNSVFEYKENTTWDDLFSEIWKHFSRYPYPRGNHSTFSEKIKTQTLFIIISIELINLQQFMKAQLIEDDPQNQYTKTVASPEKKALRLDDSKLPPRFLDVFSKNKGPWVINVQYTDHYSR